MFFVSICVSLLDWTSIFVSGFVWISVFVFVFASFLLTLSDSDFLGLAAFCSISLSLDFSLLESVASDFCVSSVSIGCFFSSVLLFVLLSVSTSESLSFLVNISDEVDLPLFFILYFTTSEVSATPDINPPIAACWNTPFQPPFDLNALLYFSVKLLPS